MTPTCIRCGHSLRSHISQRRGTGRICDGRPAALPPPSLLADILLTFGADEDKLWSTIICARLATIAPETYGLWTPTMLAAALKNYGIKPRQTWGPGPGRARRNRNGLRHGDVLRALGASASPLGSSGSASDRNPR
jgi:hypothetical protein